MKNINPLVLQLIETAQNIKHRPNKSEHLQIKCQVYLRQIPKAVNVKKRNDLSTK